MNKQTVTQQEPVNPTSDSARPPSTNVLKLKFITEMELAGLARGSAVVALGLIAHKSVIAGLGLAQKDYAFAHGAEHDLPHGITLIDSYHCSRYNTQTRRLTRAMFERVFARARALRG